MQYFILLRFDSLEATNAAKVSISIVQCIRINDIYGLGLNTLS